MLVKQDVGVQMLVKQLYSNKDVKKEKILDMVSIFLNLLKLVLWPNIWSILENVLCVPEKNSCWRECSVCLLGPFGLKYSSSLIFPDWFSVWVSYPLLKSGYCSPILLLYCCLFLPSDLFMFALYSFVLWYWVSLNDLLCFYEILGLKVYFVSYKYSHSRRLWFPFAWNIFF